MSAVTAFPFTVIETVAIRSSLAAPLGRGNGPFGSASGLIFAKRRAFRAISNWLQFELSIGAGSSGKTAPVPGHDRAEL
jgi:hypothetical protein